jgi:hypothetical protein
MSNLKGNFEHTALYYQTAHCPRDAVYAKEPAVPKMVLMSNLYQIAEPTIEQVSKQYFKDPSTSKEISKKDRKGATELFMSCMDSYGHQRLPKKQAELFEYFYDLEGKQHRDFCQIFGPEKIIENLGEFVGYYLISKVMLDADEMALAARVVADFCDWLAANGFITKANGKKGSARALRAAEMLPRAENANRLIWQIAQKCPQNVEEYFDYGQMTFKRFERDSAWLEADDGTEIGPVVLPNKAALLLKPNWTINCALAKSRGKWHFAEVGNVYPD